jgi:hypothetical protein
MNIVNNAGQNHHVRMMTLNKTRTEILALLGTMIIRLIVEIIIQTYSHPPSFAVHVVAVLKELMKANMHKKILNLKLFKYVVAKNME